MVTKALIPDEKELTVTIGRKRVHLTNLDKVYWPEKGYTKGDLLRYYASIAEYLIPHVKDRAMVMKRYPGGIHSEFFFMKHAPASRPEWLNICNIKHSSGKTIDFPIVDDLASLLWVVNLGCIDLNQWYSRCDDVDRPDYLHFDLDPGTAPFSQVRESALLVRDGLLGLKMPVYAKTSGSKGIHIYVPIVRGPLQKEVWSFAHDFAHALAKLEPDIVTSEFRKEKRTEKRVLIDYNQNRWGSTLASVYSVRPTELASVSAPVAWREIEKGCKIEDFRIDNMLKRIEKIGELWAPLLKKTGRFNLSALVSAKH